MDKKLKIGLLASIVVVIAVAALLISGSLGNHDEDSQATPFGARVYLDDGSDPYSEYSGTGTSMKNVIQDALAGHDVVFASNGNITSVEGVKNDGDRRWVVFKWASPAGWSPVTDVFKATHDGVNLAVRYSERVKDDQGNVSYSAPDIGVKCKVHFLIKMEEELNATSWLKELPISESQKRDGFWISGEGSTANEALANAVLNSFYENSKVEIREDGNIVTYIVDGRGDDIKIPGIDGASEMGIPNTRSLNLGFDADSTGATDLIVRLVDSEGKGLIADGKVVTAGTDGKSDEINAEFQKKVGIRSVDNEDGSKFSMDISKEVYSWVESKFPGISGYKFEVYAIDKNSQRITGSVFLTPSKDAQLDMPFFKYLTSTNMYGWLLSFLGWSDTKVSSNSAYGIWTYWVQYTYNPDAETDDNTDYWDFNQWSFGMYDISKYHYFGLVLKTSEMEDKNIDLPTPSEIPEGL